MRSPARLTDSLQQELTARRPTLDRVGIRGHGRYVLIGPDGVVKLRGDFVNLITDYGDQYYAEAGAQVSPPLDVTGMRLGTDGATAVAKNGAGSFISTYVSGSNKALDAVPGVTDLGAGLGHQVQYITTWAAGEATASGIDEAVITNETPLTDVAGAAGNTLSRAILAPVVNKGALDVLVLTWDHDLLGA